MNSPGAVRSSVAARTALTHAFTAGRTASPPTKGPLVTSTAEIEELTAAHVPSDWTDLYKRAVDTVRVLASDAVQKVGNGHPGTAMSLALWSTRCFSG